MLNRYMPDEDPPDSRDPSDPSRWLSQIINNPFWGASTKPVNYAQPGTTQSTYVNPWDHPAGIFYTGGSQFGAGTGQGSPQGGTVGSGPPGGIESAPATSPWGAAAAGGASTFGQILRAAAPFLPMLAGGLAGIGGGSSSGMGGVEDEIRKLLALQVARTEQAQPTYDAMLALANAMAPNPQNWR